MNIESAFQSVKVAWANARYLKAQRKEQPEARPALTSDELTQTYERLKAASEGNEELLKDLEKLKSTADGGLRVSWWSRRFVFGFGVAKAIEQWFHALDEADPKKPLLARIPRQETSNVAAKWMWFQFSTALIGVLFSLSVAGLTAYFLYQQTSILAQQAENTRQTNMNAQRTQYAQILYDEICEPAEVDTPEAEANGAETCRPAYNSRIRTEAAIAFLTLERNKKTEPDFSQAQLERTSLSHGNFRAINFSNSNLKRADFQQADLSYSSFFQANLRGALLYRATLKKAVLLEADLEGSNLSQAMLSEANFNGANLTEANIQDADLQGVSLIKANLKLADFRGANLSGADLDRADLSGALFDNLNRNPPFQTVIYQSQLDMACGDEDTKLPQGLTIKPCKAN